jgi:hypothetical protein
MADRRFEREGSFDRLWRLLALFVLCALVYYFSFDNGREASKARLERLAAENESLRLRISLQREEIEGLNLALRNLAAPARTTAPAPAPASPPPAAQAPSPETETVVPAPAPATSTSIYDPETGFVIGAPAPPDPADGESARGTIAAGGPLPETVSPGSGTIPATERTEETQAVPSPDGGKPEVTRVQLRGGENKLIVDNKVLVSLVEVDSLDKTAVVRVHQLDAERRETRTMNVGDSFVVERADGGFRLILDQLKGSLATFLLIS